jgi:hypothetical protein
MKARSVFALLFLLSACGKDRVELLSERADAYNRSLRWSSLTAASSLIEGENRRTLLARLTEQMSKNKIVDYSIVDLSIDDKRQTGSVVVEFSYVDNSTQELMYRQEAQIWKYDRKKKDWFVSDVKPL